MPAYRVFSVIILLVLCGGAFPSGPAAAPAPGRIIKFPATSIGKLYLRPAGSRLNRLDRTMIDGGHWNYENPYDGQPQEWREAGDARGAVTVPPGQEAMLELRARKSLPSLDQLGAADLQGFMISTENPSEEYDKALLRHVSRLSGLRFLDASGLRLTGADLDFLKPLTALEFLRMGGLQLKGGGLEKLGGLTRLEELSFYGGLGDPVEPPPEEALRPLKNLPALKRLSFSMCRLSARDLEVLPDLPHLEKLNLYFASFIDKPDLAYLKKCRALRELDLTSLNINDGDLALLGGIRTLEKLNLSGNTLTGEGLRNLKPLDRLDTLELMLGYNVTDKGLAALGELTSLRNLVLDGYKFTDAGTPALGKLVNLEYLHLGNSSLTDAGAAFFDNLTNLRTLILSENRMTDQMFVHLRGASRLRKIQTAIALGDEGLKALGRLPLEKFPRLDPERISDAGFVMIPRAEMIDHFEFGKSKVTDAGLAHLKDLPGVRVLNLQQSKITDRGLAEVAALPNLAELDLTSTTVSDAGMACLAGLRALKKLNLQETKISNAGLQALGKMKGLEELVLRNTAITGDGLKPLAEMNGLTTLDLSRTKITDAGLAPLERLPKLAHLDVADTAVSDGGMAAISRITPLTFLRLDGAAISGGGLKPLTGLSALRVISLERTSITQEEVNTLHSALPNATFYLAESGAAEGEKPGADLPGMIRQTKSGLTLYRCLLAARKRGIALATLPAPTREALRDYFGYFIYADFKPALFWPSYPARWQEGLRRVHRHALLSGDQNNVLSSVPLMPLLYTPREMGAIFAPRSMMLAINCESLYGVLPPECLDEDYYAARDAWIDAAWKQASARQRNEIVDVFFREQLASVCDEDLRGIHSPYSNRERILARAERMPLRDWLRKNPKKLNALLHDDNYDVRQGALLLAMGKENDLLLNPRDPDVIRLMIEGLKDDFFRENQDVYDRLLVQNPAVALPALRRAFLRTGNGQQKMFLCTLLVYLNDAATRPQQLDYLYGLLAAGEMGQLPPWHGSRRLYWTLDRMVALGDSAREYLKKKVKSSADPQQLAFTILALHALRGTGGIQWNERLVNTLAQGLRTNKVDWDLGVCGAALKLGKPDALEPLKRAMAKRKDDKQFQRAANALCAYYAGDMAGYLKLKDVYGQYSFDTNYWEFGDLGDFTADAARKNIGNIVNTGGAGSELQDWSYRARP